MEESHLIEFYGRECVHCREMEPLLQKLEKELGIRVQRIETWHSMESQRLFEKYSRGTCLSIPFFYNKKTGKSICGLASYEKLKEWALGE